MLQAAVSSWTLCLVQQQSNPCMNMHAAVTVCYQKMQRRCTAPLRTSKLLQGGSVKQVLIPCANLLSIPEPHPLLII